MDDEGILVPFPTLPLADATGSIARRRPGRPRKVERRPTIDDLAHHAAVAADRARHVDADDLVSALRDRSDATEVLRRVRERIAIEASVLEHERLERQKRGLDVGQIASRRVDALSRLAALEVEAQRLSATVVDPRSPAMQRLFEAWVTDLVQVARACMSAEAFDAFTGVLAARFENWEERAEALLR